MEMIVKRGLAHADLACNVFDRHRFAKVGPNVFDRLGNLACMTVVGQEFAQNTGTMRLEKPQVHFFKNGGSQNFALDRFIGKLQIPPKCCNQCGVLINAA